jgi:hypothetical protein
MARGTMTAREHSVTGEGGAANNRDAKAAARSAFESNKQRFLQPLA